MRQRGSTLFEVMVAIALLTLVFLLVSQDMIATVNAQGQAGTNSVAVSQANYLLSVVQADSGGNFWSSGPPWSGYSPTASCGAMPQMNGSYVKPPPNGPDTNPWQALPTNCGNNNLEFMWAATQSPTDTNAANIQIWVKTANGVYESTGMAARQPPGLNYGTAPTKSPTPKPSPTPTPSPTPKPSPTPTPSPTIGV